MGRRKNAAPGRGCGQDWFRASSNRHRIRRTVCIGGRIAAPIGRITEVAQIIAGGNLHAATEALKSLTGKGRDAPAGKPALATDETGRLLAAMDTMTGNLSSLVGQVQYSGIQVTSSATEIAASARELEATTAQQAASTTEVVTSAT